MVFEVGEGGRGGSSNSNNRYVQKGQVLCVTLKCWDLEYRFVTLAASESE